jgi:hypothetical protein
MSARQQPDSPKLTLQCWAACLTVCWFVTQIVDLAAQVLR